MNTSDYEKHDIPTEYLLHKQLSSGIRTYRSSVMVVSMIRVAFVVAIWSILLSRISSVTPMVIAIVALIGYAFVEAYSAVRKIRAARWAMETVERGWRDEF